MTKLTMLTTSSTLTTTATSHDHIAQVDENGEVVRNTWEDCEEGCPGTNFECNEGFLFNIEGECVNGTQAPGIVSRIGNTCSE